MKTYSDGKLNKQDGGDLKIVTYIEQGRLVLNFGEDVAWIGFNKQTLRDFIDGLENQYKNL